MSSLCAFIGSASCPGLTASLFRLNELELWVCQPVLSQHRCHVVLYRAWGMWIQGGSMSLLYYWQYLNLQCDTTIVTVPYHITGM